MLTGLPPFYSQDIQVMYQKIMSAKLLIPNYLSQKAIHLLKQLIDRDPEKRLQDPKDIMSHPFFEGLDWQKLNNKQITPPYIPQKCEDSEDDQREFLDYDDDVQIENDFSDFEFVPQLPYDLN
jgi:serine/threonine protein kinase